MVTAFMVHGVFCESELFFLHVKDCRVLCLFRRWLLMAPVQLEWALSSLNGQWERSHARLSSWPPGPGEWEERERERKEREQIMHTFVIIVFSCVCVNQAIDNCLSLFYGCKHMYLFICWFVSTKPLVPIFPYSEVMAVIIRFCFFFCVNQAIGNHSSVVWGDGREPSLYLFGCCCCCCCCFVPAEPIIIIIIIITSFL